MIYTSSKNIAVPIMLRTMMPMKNTTVWTASDISPQAAATLRFIREAHQPIIHCCCCIGCSSSSSHAISPTGPSLALIGAQMPCRML